jgi:Membrane-associated sensor, integral membrane domain
MTGDASADAATWLVNQPPTSKQAWSARAGAAALILGLVVLAPFAAKPLPHVNGFVPALDATIVVTDLITAALLFAQFAIIHSRAPLALACGYLFSGLIVVAHALSFPGAFSSTGDFGGSYVGRPVNSCYWRAGVRICP